MIITVEKSSSFFPTTSTDKRHMVLLGWNCIGNRFVGNFNKISDDCNSVLTKEYLGSYVPSGSTTKVWKSNRCMGEKLTILAVSLIGVIYETMLLSLVACCSF
jgi:hypothetical protein